MKKKRLSKQQLLEKQKLDDKKFNRTMLISFGILFIGVLSVLVFYTYWCDTRFAWRKIAWYKHEVPANWICMKGDNLQIHESHKAKYKGETYYFCSQSCFNHLVKHFNEVAYTTDPVSGDTLLKANALIGLKKRNKTEVAYFKNKQNFKKYYESK
ncbi:hypothetical protein [Sunxiuqinia rutila]|uniref:hypothetical protein n=1 Tax=Sunxiuqinia rutila TaxID=1397841 RepID=UPI003D36FCAE